MLCVNKLTPYDFPQIKRIFEATFPRTDDADFANAWRTKECNYSLGLFHKATLVGFAITCLDDDDDGAAAHLWFIAVDAEQRSTGAGSLLLTALIETVQADGLRLILTPDNNQRVISWYKKHGFIITKTMPFIHQDIPTCWMELDCKEPDSPISTLTLSSRESISIDEDALEI
jgi:ribosomal protein S18 acetylase RimI-like enzyme